ncbi:uncharacterized protein AB675_9125 [Cyphellophora attinorum]|uniref:Uncharacterized protein n=1 Tax=Cyphellophora attinorum TaxID=1664694 RepID=A0A0N1NZ84_9EURO|nr:uncharacterized protein AB675_9125 [Phialophora attinorum]KPI41473.1 hypothetical protein AB675_9125 [Phialophora attinorum]
MSFLTLFVLCLVSVVTAAPDANVRDLETTLTTTWTITSQIMSPTVTTVTATRTITSLTATVPVPTPTEPNSCTIASTEPPSNDTLGYLVRAYNPGTPIDGLSMEAASTKFWLGGAPATYCPYTDVGTCGTMNTTAVRPCDLAVMVPGGQGMHANERGQIYFTHAHSNGSPNPSERCPFEYEYAGGLYGELRPASWAFGAYALMACPRAERAWLVMLAMENITNPMVPSDSVADCIEFIALTTNVTHVGAWQYI